MATVYNQNMDAKCAQKRHEDQQRDQQVGEGAGPLMQGAAAAGDNPMDNKSNHPTIAAALGFGPPSQQKTSPGKEGKR